MIDRQNVHTTERPGRDLRRRNVRLVGWLGRDLKRAHRLRRQDPRAAGALASSVLVWRL